jgi:clan AA aspartic protease
MALKSSRVNPLAFLSLRVACERVYYSCVLGVVRLVSCQADFMGLIRGFFVLANPTRPELAPVEVSALADTGAVHLCIPEHLAIQLSLVELERREVVLADGHRRTVPYVGPVEVRFRNRRCFTGAMVLGTEVLLGAIPMEDMDLVLRPQMQSVDVNPDSPNIPLSAARSASR